MIDYPDAIDEMKGRFLQTLTAGYAAILPYMPEVRYSDLEANGVPDQSKVWVRYTAKNIGSPQKAICADVSAPGNRRFENFGVIMIDIFVPRSDIQGNQKGPKLANMIAKGFKNQTENGIVFRNSTPTQKDHETSFFVYGVTCEYEFNSIF